jgi:hypothetical protein
MLGKTTFSLPVKPRPAFEYLDYLHNRYGIKFLREFHIGGYEDRDKPYIRYAAEKDDWGGEMGLWFEQQLTTKAFREGKEFLDAEGDRDLEAIANALNVKNNIVESFRVGWTGPAQALGASHRCYRSGYFTIEIEKNKWTQVSGSDQFTRDCGEKKAILGRMVEGTDSPFANPNIRRKLHQFMDARDFSNATNMLLADVVGEAIKIYWPQLRNETAKDKVLRDQLFGGVRMGKRHLYSEI